MKTLPAGVGTLGLLMAVLCGASCSGPPTGEGAEAPLFQKELDTAEEVYFSGQYDSASVLLTGILDRTRDLQTSSTPGHEAVAAQARATTWLGLAAWRLGDYEKARRLGEEALALKLNHRLNDQLFRSYNALGLLAWNENRLSEARRLYKKALESAEADEKPLEAASARGNLALVQTELGEFSDAREGFLAMRSTAAKAGEVRIEGNALTNLGMLEIRVGNANAALPYLEEARTRYDSIGYPTGVLSVLGQLGTAYMALGEPQPAFAVMDSALGLAREQGLRQEEASNLEILAELYRDAGDVHRALSLYADARIINDELGLDVETGADLRGEAEIQANLANLFEAHSLASQALQIHRNAGARLEELFDLLLLAEIQSEMEATAAVKSTLFQARQLAHDLDARVARTELALTEARIADKNHDSQAVLQLTGEVSQDLNRSGSAGEWEAYLLRSKAFARQGKEDSAVSAGWRALDAVERVRADFGSSVLRTAYVSDKGEAYSHLVSLLLRQGRVREAFSVSDAARGRAILEHLAAADLEPWVGTALAGLREGETILREIDQLIESADYLEDFPPEERNEGQEAELDNLHRRIDSLRVLHSDLTIRTAEADPVSGAFLGNARTTAENVQGVLSPGQVLLEYLTTREDTLFIFLLTPDKIRSFQLPVEMEGLTSRVRLARGLIAQDPDNAEQARAVLAGLHESLLGPALESGEIPPGSQLLVVPHGPLAYLPFSALLNRSTQRYLAQDFLIRVLPSAGVLPALAARHPTSPGPAIQAQVLAPFPEDLPSTLEEVEAVDREIPGTHLFLGRRATERRLRRSLETRDVVHVATHGRLNRRNPMFSRLELARGKGESRDDGRFEVHELFSTPVTSPLVFLSGCETAAGRSGMTTFDTGEDIATLSQAFLYAGARNVVATLWPVEDEGAAVFAEAFYRALGQNSPSRALAAAQRALLTTENLSSPFFWAAYQISGDDLLEKRDRVAVVEPSEREAHKPGAGAVQYE